ncbi:restriction endonuclease subunit S [Salinicoccus roseus]|uniref:restriction endonuclease subunit S n=1 Tax=Salinicoccus roseus TaxID=45670 RepID=UPI002301CE19|nr:restriction endonuclease subunit S [Salinicoccus roseus]
MGFKEVRLSEICEIVMGQSPRSEFYNDSIGTPFLQGNRTFGHIYPTIDTYTTKVTKSADKGDLLMSVRAPVGELNLAPVDLCIGRGLCAIKPKINKYFVYYLLKQEIDNLESQSTGTIFSSVNKTTLNNLKVKIPKDESSQDQIGDFLWSIDNKIQINNNIIANLEELSQTLFKRWFVDFEFPDENGNPYKSSGGEMKKHENESLPSDWVDKKLKNIINISSGKRPKVKNDVKFGNMQYPIIGASKIMGYTDEYLYDEKIIVTGRVGTHGIVQKFNEEVWPSDNSFVITSDYFNFTENILKNIDFKSLNRGSTQPLITQTDLKNLKIFVPEDMEIMKKFENTFEENTNFIFNLNKENIHLRRLRDTLLPKLMSGEIELPEELEV